MQPACSAASLAAAEPVTASAPDAVAWLCLEQNGPWGAKAWTSSHLDHELGGRLEAVAGAAGVRPSLIRRPGKHADLAGSQRHTVLVASTHPDEPWLLSGVVDDPASLLDLDLAALAAGDRGRVQASLPALVPHPESVLLVCTNGTRDTCCARLGRPVALDAARSAPGRVWEVTHTSGHRFAPTTVLLPSGHLHGRVLDAAALLAHADAGELDLSGWRGRSTWPSGGQSAEEHVRRHLDLTGLDDLAVTASGTDWKVTHRDGRTWRVRVTSSIGPERVPSCGKPPEPAVHHETTLLG